jgi:hypothetical protein
MQQRDWELHSAETEELNAVFMGYNRRIKMIYDGFNKEFFTVAEAFLNEVVAFKGGKAIFPKKVSALLREEMPFRMKPYIEDAKKSIGRILPSAERLYEITVTGPNARYASVCERLHANGKTPVIVVLGYIHGESFPEELKKRGLSCAVLELEGASKNTLSCTPNQLRGMYMQIDSDRKYKNVQIEIGEDRRVRLTR